MRYTRTPFDVVGYQYQADFFCPACQLDLVTMDLVEQGIRFAVLPDAESALDALAERAGIDRNDEWSYDSDDFPKVIFRDQADDDTACGRCGRTIGTEEQ